MILRPYHKQDYKQVRAMLEAEGIPEDQQVFERVLTWVVDNDGDVLAIFSLIETKPHPTMRYFCVKKIKNRLFVARVLLRMIRRLLKDSGYRQLNVNADKEYLQKMIEYYFRVPAYRHDDKGFFYYLVEV